MVEQRPTYLFDVGDSGWREHLDSLPENTWLDPQHLPDFGQILHHVDSPASPVYEAVVNKPHYMRALFVAQIKVSVWQMPEKTWLDPQHLPDFGQILHHVDSPASPVYEAVVNKPHYMRALFVA